MKDFSAYELVELTHVPNSPCSKTFERSKFSELSDIEIAQAFNQQQ